MERVTAKLRHGLKTSSDGGFKFTISLVVACLSVLYKIHSYAAYNPITQNLFVITIIVIFSFTCSLSAVVLYIFFKALSLETKSDKNKEKFEEAATNYYLSAFYIALISFVISAALLIAYNVSIIFDLKIGLYSLLIFVVFLSFVFLTIIFLFKIIRLLIYQTRVSIVYFIIIVGFFVSFAVMPLFLTGNLTYELNSVYHKQAKQILVDISLTGFPSKGVFVDLYREDSTNLVLIDSIEIQFNTSKICKSTYLCGDNLGLGKYKAFIDCSNLSEGYYQVSVTSGKDYNDRFRKQSLIDRYFNNNERINDSFYLIGN